MRAKIQKKRYCEDRERSVAGCGNPQLWGLLRDPFSLAAGPEQLEEPSELCSAKAFSMSHRLASKLAGGTS